MLASPFSLSPTPADLKNFLIACSQHPLHAKLRRGVEKPLTRGYSIDVGFWSWGRNPVGGLNFEITLINKEFSYGLDEVRPLLKRFLAPR